MDEHVVHVWYLQWTTWACVQYNRVNLFYFLVVIFYEKQNILKYVKFANNAVIVKTLHEWTYMCVLKKNVQWKLSKQL